MFKIVKSNNMKNRNSKKKTNYVPVAENVYQTGQSYRVRITVNGERFSQNFNSKQKAIRFRNEKLRTQLA